MSGRPLVPLLALAVALAGCGLKGPLYLPEKSKEVVVRPAAGTVPEAPPTEAPPAEAPEAESGAGPEAPAAPETPPPGTDHG